MINNLTQYPSVREVNYDSESLKDFENDIIENWESHIISSSNREQVNSEIDNEH